MPEEQVRVTFEPSGRSVVVLSGSKVPEAAAKAGLTIEQPCGGEGVCGKCRVQITGGACPPCADDLQTFSPEELRAGWRLACQTTLCGPAVIQIPATSLFGAKHQILVAAHDANAEVLPAVRKVYVELPLPTLTDATPDLLRLERLLGPIKTDLALLRQLPSILRREAFKGTAVLTDHHLIDFEPGDTSEQCYGAAFDIGTTTLVGSLLNLRTGEEAAVASRINPQVSFGDDVLSRIKHSTTVQGGLAELQQIIVAAVVDMIEEMCREAKVSREHIYEVAFAGNTTMQILLCAIDVSPLGQVPFVPAHGRGLILSARDLGIPVHHRAAAYVFPIIGSFVGGDTVAGILVTRLAKQDGPVMMVDIGTNGEIVLAHNGRMYAASTAAGPAFEGARISCGMRAASGAVEKVVFDGDVRYSVIGGTSPIGLCGSGLIDAAAELLKSGIVTPEGRMRGPEELGELPGLPEALRRRVSLDAAGQPQFLLAESPRRDVQVLLTQRDIRELQLATGAIRAGIAIVLRQAGLTTADLKHVYIAGGFGSFIRRSNAQRIGLLPPGVHHERITYVGNASLDGARWALLSTNARTQAEELARQAEHVELSQDSNFHLEFADAMIFPEA
jgi:uncharacterized 2Fe-2S/4Fe-4S cluster protein (DUF4445 family)